LVDPDLREPSASFRAESPQHYHEPVAVEYFSELTVITDGSLHHLLAERNQLLRCHPSLRARPALAIQLRYQRYQDVRHLTLKHYTESSLEVSQVQMSSDRTDGFGEVGNVVREAVLGHAVKRRLG
jgi:hypothetical protein